MEAIKESMIKDVGTLIDRVKGNVCDAKRSDLPHKYQNRSENMVKTSLQIGDVYALQERETGKWFAFQIVQIEKKSTIEWARYVNLDYWSEKMPEERDLKKMSYFRTYWDNKMMCCWSEVGLFPAHAVLVGNMAVRPVEGPLERYGPWPYGYQQKATGKLEIMPKDQANALKHRKYNYFFNDERLNGLQDFSVLDNLPGYIKFNIAKDYPQLIPFMERSWLVDELKWESCPRRELDLSRTHLQELEISGEDVEIIHLPISIEKLTLKGKLSPNLRILSPNDGYSMNLCVELQDDFLPNICLDRLKELCLQPIRDFSLHDIASRFPGLTELWLVGKPGYIHDVAEISKLHKLEKLVIQDLFGFSADDFPRPEVLSELRILWLMSIPAEAGKEIKKWYRGKVNDLEVIKLRSEEWLRENMNNPLRHWDGSEFVPKAKYTKSVALWKETRRRMMEETSHTELDLSAVKQIAIDYAEGFNKLDRRSSFIETEQREDIFNAFEQILDEAGLSEFKEEIIEQLDEKRDW